LIVAGDPAIGDGDIAGGAGIAKGKTGLGADAVVPRRVDGAVGDAHILAAVDVHTIAVGIDFEVVDGEVVDAGEQEAKVAAFEDGKIAKDDVVAVLESDGLIAYAGLLSDKRAALVLLRPAIGEAFAPDEAGAGDADVMEVFAPEQRVVPVVVSVVLIGIPCCFWFGGIVNATVVAGQVTGEGRFVLR